MSQSLDTLDKFAYTQPSTLPRHVPICKLLDLQVMVFLRKFAGNRQLVVQLVDYAVSFYV